MSRSIFTSLLVALALSSGAAAAQTAEPQIPEAQRVRKLARQHLAGPRFGFTVFTGDVAAARHRAGLQPMMTQFGWQWETQLVSQDSGNQVLMEWILLAGGVEQDELNLSLGWISGYRLPNGLEFGVGPNLSYSKDTGKTTSSMIFAAGATAPFGDIFIPINFAVSLAKGGPRVTALLGWIVG